MKNRNKRIKRILTKQFLTKEYIEIKGYWRDDAKIKYKLFRKKYPNKDIKVLMKIDLQQLGILK